MTLVTPGVKDDLGEIVNQLAGLDKLMDGVDRKSTGSVPDKKQLFQEISKLGADIGKAKRDQAGRIEAIKDEIKNRTESQVLQSVEGRIDTLIADAVAARVREEMMDWGKKPGVKKFAGELQTTVDRNNLLVEGATITLENLRARHSNSTLDVQEDHEIKLTAIKREDGKISETFPINLRELFSYQSEQLAQLFEEYGLRPLEKHTENLNRFLAFIGVSASIPDQPINTSDEQPPAYVNMGDKGEKNRGGPGRGASQDPKRNTRSSWWSS
jgi:hypothetical protein